MDVWECMWQYQIDSITFNHAQLQCKCLDPSKQNCKGTCGAEKFKGDGVCDDNNNNCGCDYDGGDCCANTVKGGKLNTNYCQKCECKAKKKKV